MLGSVGSGSSSFTPDNATGDEFVAIAGAPSPPGDTAFASSVSAVITGYNGPACNCNLHLDFIKIGSPVGSITITYGPSFLVALSIPLLGSLVTGAYDYPFSIPSSGGTPYNIYVAVQVQAATAPGPVAISADGKITNVP